MPRRIQPRPLPIRLIHGARTAPRLSLVGLDKRRLATRPHKSNLYAKAKAAAAAEKARHAAQVDGLEKIFAQFSDAFPMGFPFEVQRVKGLPGIVIMAIASHDLLSEAPVVFKSETGIEQFYGKPVTQNDRTINAYRFFLARVPIFIARADIAMEFGLTINVQHMPMKIDGAVCKSGGYVIAIHINPSGSPDSPTDPRPLRQLMNAVVIEKIRRHVGSAQDERFAAFVRALSPHLG